MSAGKYWAAQERERFREAVEEEIRQAMPGNFWDAHENARAAADRIMRRLGDSWPLEPERGDCPECGEHLNENDPHGDGCTRAEA